MKSVGRLLFQNAAPGYYTAPPVVRNRVWWVIVMRLNEQVGRVRDGVGP